MSAKRLSWTEFHAQTNVPYSTFARWREKGHCPILGRKLRVFPAPRTGPNDGPKFFIDRRDAEELAKRRQQWNGELTIGGALYVSTTLGRERFGLDVATMKARHMTPCAELGGRKLRMMTVKVVEAAGKDGRLRRKKRRVWHAGDLAKISAGCIDDPNWLDYASVAEQSGFAEITLWEWRKRGCPYLNGRKLRSRLRRVRTGRRREYCKADLDEIVRNYKPDVTSVPEWANYIEAGKEFGFGQSTLSYWANENCTHLGRTLKTKTFRAGVGNRMMQVTKYSRDDLQAIAHKRDGTAPAAATNGTNANPTAAPATAPTERAATRIRLAEQWQPVIVLGKEKPPLPVVTFELVQALVKAGVVGLSKDEIEQLHGSARKVLKSLREKDPDWAEVIHMAKDKGSRYQIW